MNFIEILTILSSTLSMTVSIHSMILTNKRIHGMDKSIGNIFKMQRSRIEALEAAVKELKGKD